MERRPHPNHDRTTLRRALTGFAISLLAFLGGVIARECGAGEWIKWPVLAGVFAGFVYIFRIPVNRCACPACGAPLVRLPEGTEFTCTQCAIIWVTRSWGRNVFE